MYYVHDKIEPNHPQHCFPPASPPSLTHSLAPLPDRLFPHSLTRSSPVQALSSLTHSLTRSSPRQALSPPLPPFSRTAAFLSFLSLPLFMRRDGPIRKSNQITNSTLHTCIHGRGRGSWVLTAISFFTSDSGIIFSQCFTSDSGIIIFSQCFTYVPYGTAGSLVFEGWMEGGGACRVVSCRDFSGDWLVGEGGGGGIW